MLLHIRDVNYSCHYLSYIKNPKKLNKEIVSYVKNYFYNKHDSYITFHENII